MQDAMRQNLTARLCARPAAIAWVALALWAAPASGQEASPEPSENAAENSAEGQGLMSRIDFGNAYVMGQSIKSGAVYLLNRKKSEIASMLKERKDFRREIRQDAQVAERETE